MWTFETRFLPYTLYKDQLTLDEESRCHTRNHQITRGKQRPTQRQLG